MFDDFYGLSGKPFQLMPDPAFYFRSATHRKALAYLGYGLAQCEGFVVVTGEVGAGKSTLVAHLTASIDPGQLTLGQLLTNKLDEEEIVHAVAQGFGLETEGGDRMSVLGAIEGFLHAEARAGRRCLLIADEAQNLSIAALENLRMLSNFQFGNRALLQTLLLGQPEFRVTLQEDKALEQLRQRVIAAHHLEPMGKAEIEPYIVHRLQLVGWTDNPRFDQRVFAELHQASGGIPRRINQIANRLLLLGAVEQRTRIDSAMLRSVLDEMAGEGAFPAAVPLAKPALAPSGAPSDTLPPLSPVSADMREIEAMLARRDAQIAELQQAIVELANQHDAAVSAAVHPEIEVLQREIARFEMRLGEQERSIRQTLAMLIELVEGEVGRTKAA